MGGACNSGNLGTFLTLSSLILVGSLECTKKLFRYGSNILCTKKKPSDQSKSRPPAPPSMATPSPTAEMVASPTHSHRQV